MKAETVFPGLALPDRQKKACSLAGCWKVLSGTAIPSVIRAGGPPIGMMGIACPARWWKPGGHGGPSVRSRVKSASGLSFREGLRGDRRGICFSGRRKSRCPQTPVPIIPRPRRDGGAESSSGDQPPASHHPLPNCWPYARPWGTGPKRRHGSSRPDKEWSTRLSFSILKIFSGCSAVGRRLPCDSRQ